MEKTYHNIIDVRTGETKIMGLPASVTRKVQELIYGKPLISKRILTVGQKDGEYTVRLSRLPRKIKKKHNKLKINTHGKESYKKA